MNEATAEKLDVTERISYSLALKTLRRMEPSTRIQKIDPERWRVFIRGRMADHYGEAQICEVAGDRVGLPWAALVCTLRPFGYQAELVTAEKKRGQSPVKRISVTRIQPQPVEPPATTEESPEPD